MEQDQNPGAPLPLPAATPVMPSERYDIIDIIRGFALFGIMLANIAWTGHHFAFIELGPDAAPPGIDPGQFLVGLLADHKFYTLFSMLFGLGFAMQLSRAKSRGGSAIPTYVRRLVILFLMGVAHAVLLWFGDILHTYALLGFMLIPFYKRSDRTILRWTIAIALVSLLLPALHVILHMAGVAIPDSPIAEMSGTDRVQRMTSGRWIDMIAVNLNFLAHYYTRLDLFPGSPIHWYLSVLWKFLLGFYIGRRMLLQNAADHITLFRRVFPWALGYGLLGNLAFTLGIIGGPIGLVIGYPFIEAAFFALSIAYLCGLVILHQHPATRPIVNLLAPVGRMALTNYLLQSAFYVLLFYGVGFGLLNEIGVTGCVLFSFAIFALQIVISNLWLRFFRFGPFEWLWRCLTYGKLEPLKVPPA